MGLHGRVLLARRHAQKVAAPGSAPTRRPREQLCRRLARYLGSILVPSDEIALFLLEAVSLDAATALAQQAAIPAERILEIVRLGASLPAAATTPQLVKGASMNRRRTICIAALLLALAASVDAAPAQPQTSKASGSAVRRRRQGRPVELQGQKGTAYNVVGVNGASCATGIKYMPQMDP